MRKNHKEFNNWIETNCFCIKILFSDSLEQGKFKETLKLWKSRFLYLDPVSPVHQPTKTIKNKNVQD